MSDTMELQSSCSCASCGHDNTHEHDEPFAFDKTMSMKAVRFGAGFVVYLTAILGGFADELRIPLYLAAYLIFGYDIIRSALKNIVHGKIFDENFLMSLSTIGALIIREYPEAVAVMLFFQVGEFLQEMAVGKSRRTIKALLDIKATVANLVKDGGVSQVDPETVAIGDVILIKPGEKIPLDGCVVDGESQLDVSSLTGEPVPRTVGAGDDVLSGSINMQSVLHVRVTKAYEDATVVKMLALVENAAAKKAPTEKFITQFSKVYTPVVVSAAAALALIPPLLTPADDLREWVARALVFLVVSCPCALVVSVPLTFFSGIGAASKRGVLLKGSHTIQTLSRVDTVVFDKTGTLTNGVFEVTGFQTFGGASETELLQAACDIEKFSNHPIARSILTYGRSKGIAPGTDPVKIFEETGGKGLSAVIAGNTVMAGNGKLMEANQIQYAHSNADGTVVYIAKNGVALGYIVISDIMKEDSPNAVSQLQSLGLKHIVMLTGDRKEAAEKMAGRIGIREVFADLLPHEKVEKLEAIYAERPHGKVAFIGDGINDAPVLARCDVGFAMGGVGSDAAVEAADVIIMNDAPSKVAVAITVARKTMRIVKENIVFALGVKFLVLMLAALGYANMWMAVFADVGVTLLVVIHAMGKKV